MRSRQAQMLLVFFLTGLITLGCASLSRRTAPVSNQDTIATAVAATFAAHQAMPDESTPAVLAQSSATPTIAVKGTLSTAAAAELPELVSAGALTVAYIDPSRNVWVWQPGSEARQITSFGDVESVKVSADADWIAFTRTTDFLHYALWVIRSDGSAGHPVMDSSEFDALPRTTGAVTLAPAYIGWKPGGHILVFNTRPTFEGPGLILNDDLWLVDVDAGTRSEVLSPGEGGQFYFSPDGARIALVKPDSVSLANGDGSGRRERVFVYPRVVTYSEYAYYASPIWAPDSSALFVVIPPEAALDRPEDPAVAYRVPFDGSAVVSLGSFPSALGLYPVLASNLEKIAYLRLVGASEENRRELHIANPDGAEDILYQEGAYLSFQSWSPHASRFLYSTGEESRMTMGEVGMLPQPASDRPGVGQSRWVDDDRFLFVVHDGMNIELRLRTTVGDETLVASFTGVESPLISYDFGSAGR